MQSFQLNVGFDTIFYDILDLITACYDKINNKFSQVVFLDLKKVFEFVLLHR